MTPSRPPLIDAAARERIRSDLSSTLIVEAAAGTGKTTALVDRILSLLRSGTATLASGKRDLVAVTFTEKAAGEMKLRLRTEIERVRAAATEPDERTRLDHALEQLEAARIGTIHAFCADILRERPVEARIDPLFEVAAEDEQERLYDEAFTAWFQATLARPSSEVPGVTRVLRRATRERDQDGPRVALRKAGRNLVEQRDFPTPYERPDFAREKALDGILATLKTIGDLHSKGFADSWLTKSLREIWRVGWEIERREESGEPRDYDQVEAALRTLQRQRLWGWKGSGSFYNKAEGITRTEVLDRRAAAKTKLDEVLDGADADLAAALCRELRGIVDVYEEMKQKTGKLDFLDLLVLTRDLLEHDAGVRGELQRRFGALLIDEFQDTDPLQADILFLLAADDPQEKDPGRAHVQPGKLFLVGDPKQSIYRFRRADVSFYEGIKARLEKDGAAVLQLTTSFRSAPSIQELVNAAFAPLMPKREPGAPGAGGLAGPPRSQAEYVPLSPHRGEPEGRPTIIGLPVPKPYGDYGKIVQWQIEESYPVAVGAFVDWLVNQSGWTITERGSDERVPIRSQHICLLFKRLQSFGNDITRPYVRALEARRVPHVLVGGRSFHEREEVIALRNALAAIEWPDDTFSVYATLHGPFFALGDDALLAFRHQQRHLHALRKRDESKLDELTRPVADALDVLRRLHYDRNRTAIADTIARLLEATRAHAGVAIWPAGEQALGNILRVLDMARRFEQSAVTSFRAFVLRLEEDADRGGVNEAPVVEEGTDGVRIMTVHKAKGLEFPVVILVDPTANATFREPTRHVDPAKKLWAVPLCGAAPRELIERRAEILQQDLEEAHRLLYVATTRARELLVVPALGDEIEDDDGKGWLAPLSNVLYPLHENRRAAGLAPGCPPFGEDTVLTRPDNVDRMRAEWSVKPGLHVPARGNHRVVFWDPGKLDLDREDAAGLRHQRVLTKGPAAEKSEAEHAAWRTERGVTLAKAEVPSLRVRTPTEAKTAAAEDEPVPTGIEIATTAATRAARPHGKRFGILVHAVLAAAPLDADDALLADVARIQGRLVGASEEEVAASRDAVKGALEHPVLVRARKADRLEREVGLMLREADGTLVEGVADLAFFEKGAGWTVIDFKTDLALGDRKDGYLRQIAIYARALTDATGEPARGVLLSV